MVVVSNKERTLFKVVRAETPLAQDCSVILHAEFRQYNGCLCKKSIAVTAQFFRNYVMKLAGLLWDVSLFAAICRITRKCSTRYKKN